MITPTGGERIQFYTRGIDPSTEYEDYGSAFGSRNVGLPKTYGECWYVVNGHPLSYTDEKQVKIRFYVFMTRHTTWDMKCYHSTFLCHDIRQILWKKYNISLTSAAE